MASLRRPRPAVIPAIALVLAGCTFTGLADYDTPNCDPTLAYAQDPCAGVDVGNVSCFRSQCDPVTKRCSVRALDEDKDGDPSIMCGGTDCDDHDPKRSGHQAEICDGIDNDCNAITDDGLLVASDGAAEKVLVDSREAGADLTLRTENGRDGHATYLGETSCVHDVALSSAMTASTDCITIGTGDPDASAPSAREPQQRTVGPANDSTVGIAYVDEALQAPCDRERLGFFGGNGTVGISGDCGAALPTLASFPSASEALIAFYDARIADRRDPIEGCAQAAPAPLKVRYVDGATGSTPNLYTSTAANLGDAVSTRPPAIAAVTGGAALLLASPIGTSAGLWALTPDGRVVPLAATIPLLAGARSVAMTLHDGATSIAIVAEQGCKPAQSITFVVADFDPAQTLLKSTFRKAVIVPGPAMVATAPSVAWSAPRKEWWVSWIDARQKAMLTRVSEDGTHVSPPLELGSANAVVLAIDASLPSGKSPDPLAFLSRPDRAAIDARAVSCPK